MREVLEVINSCLASYAYISLYICARKHASLIKEKDEYLKVIETRYKRSRNESNNLIRCGPKEKMQNLKEILKLLFIKKISGEEI